MIVLNLPPHETRDVFSVIITAIHPVIPKLVEIALGAPDRKGALLMLTVPCSLSMVSSLTTVRSIVLVKQNAKERLHRILSTASTGMDSHVTHITVSQRSNQRLAGRGLIDEVIDELARRADRRSGACTRGCVQYRVSGYEQL